jgi:dienelactone hydrolase
MRTIVSDFTSKGVRCAGTLYLPDGAGRPPVVIMAHGLGAERTFRLPAFAERFAKAGIAAFVFDYRNFGDSDGQPRNLISPRRHIADWLAAIAHVRSLQAVDVSRVALWGSSFSGGHVVVAAAKSKGIAATVSQVPFVNGFSLLRLFSFSFLMSAAINGIRDLVRILTFRKPHLIPIVGKPDTFALMNTPDSWDGYTGLIPKGSAWKNECPARICLTIILYRPIGYARRVKCPALFVIAERDSLVDWKDVVKTADRVKNSEKMVLAAGHFEPYTGELFEKVAARETEFLMKALSAGR